MLPAAGCGLLSCLRRDKGEAAGRTDPARVADEPAPSPSLASSFGKGSGPGTARRFAWAEIESVTAGFSSRVIGQGGFSTVYLASLSSSRLGAVKVQRSSERLHRAFRQELHVLLSLRHPHIVRLLGYCDEREEGVLVFEYAANGDLHERLHGRRGKATPPPPLPWARRMAVAFQVAMAVEHLHESKDPAVIHGDIKASNVLLDASLDAKLCDFGFAHVGFSAAAAAPAAARHVVMGSPGYVDPHFLRSGVATKKSDVYSFGVLLLELLTGREAMCAATGRRLAAAVGPMLGEGGGKVDDVVDRRLGGEYDAHEAATVAALALRCVSEGPGMRPSMAEVVRELQEKTTALISAAGCKPAGKMDS